MTMGKKIEVTSLGPAFWCPACNQALIAYKAGVQPNGHAWTWNGDVDEPTIAPSWHFVGVCHVTVANGLCNFSGDCSHAMNGKTGVPLPDWPEGCSGDDYIP